MFVDKDFGRVGGFFRKLAAPKKPLEAISGLYLGEDKYLHVVSQPANQPSFVSSISRTVTDFQLASRFGNIGLIAHNYLGGKHFLSLRIGDVIHVTQSNRIRRDYKVWEIRQYQALDPRNPRSSFIDLQSNQRFTASEVFKQVYTGSHRVVLQTCIQRGKMMEWGRHFVIARPVSRVPQSR